MFRRHTLYVLTDPRPEYQSPAYELRGVLGVRYVGKTCKPLEVRLAEHLKDETVSYKTSWLRRLRAMGLRPRIEPIRTDIPDEQINDLEKALIAEARAKIGNKLTNTTEGGDGVMYSIAQMEESQARGRPGNMPVQRILRDVVAPAIRDLMMEPGRRYLPQIGYQATRDSLRQLSTMKVGTEYYRIGYQAALDGLSLPGVGKLTTEAGYIHGLLVAAGLAEPA